MYFNVLENRSTGCSVSHNDIEDIMSRSLHSLSILFFISLSVLHQISHQAHLYPVVSAHLHREEEVGPHDTMSVDVSGHEISGSSSLNWSTLGFL